MSEREAKVYCRKLLEVTAIQVRRDNADELKKFVGSGTLVLPEDDDDLCYFYTREKANSFSALEGQFIVKFPNGDFEPISEQYFNLNYERKSIPNAPSDMQNIVNRFDHLFTRNLDLRLRKLTEEYNELIASAENYRNTGKLTDADKENIVDELADVNAVLFHIASLFGLSQRELLDMAVDKIEGRFSNPNYKRKHAHTGDECCGNCKYFVNEEVDGDGYCDNQERMRHCSCLACYEWQEKPTAEEYKQFEQRFNKVQ